MGIWSKIKGIFRPKVPSVGKPFITQSEKDKGVSGEVVVAKTPSAVVPSRGRGGVSAPAPTPPPTTTKKSGV